MIKANPRNYLYNTVHMEAPERNGFDLSHENKQTARAGVLYPYEVFEALPSDDFELYVEQFIRLNPMLSPTMHRLKAYWHWFFIPNRLCWNHWEEFISRGNGKKLDADQSYTPPEMPYLTLGQIIMYGPACERVQAGNTFKSTNDCSTEAKAQLVCDEFTQQFPEIVAFVTTQDDEYGTPHYYPTVALRTPRVANAMHIPDVPIPLYALVETSATPSEYTYTLTKLTDASINKFSAYGNYIGDIKIQIIPLLAQFLCFVEYYRDQNLQSDYADMIDFFKNSIGSIDTSDETAQTYVKRLLQLNYRCWEKDYFTTSTQLPQKAPDVLIPGTGELISHTHEVSAWFQDNQKDIYIQPSGQLMLQDNEGSDGGVGQDENNMLYANTGLNEDKPLSYSEGLKLDGTLGTSCSDPRQVESGGITGTISALRRAFALQRWFEKVLRTGTRYVETLKGFFNSNAGDSRLQRPEFIGASSSPIQISDVVQSSGTDADTDTVQGNLAGYGINSDSSQTFSFHCPEHGFIVGFFNISARTSYGQGIPRMFSRETWLDYAWPEFEKIGEQGIKQKELCFAPRAHNCNELSFDAMIHRWNFTDAGNEVFGYQSRNSEYKSQVDIFGSGFGASLDFWHLGRIFDSSPTLSEQFVKENVSDRNFAVVGNDQEFTNFIERDGILYDECYDYDTYICDFWVTCKKVTSLSLYSEPY